MDDQNTNNELMPDPITSTLYIPGYLKTQIGKLVIVEFLVGNTFTDRTGVLLKVGVSYIIIRPIESNGVLLCDMYSIKFVTVIERPNLPMYGGMMGV